MMTDDCAYRCAIHRPPAASLMTGRGQLNAMAFSAIDAAAARTLMMTRMQMQQLANLPSSISLSLPNVSFVTSSLSVCTFVLEDLIWQLKMRYIFRTVSKFNMLFVRTWNVFFSSYFQYFISREMPTSQSVSLQL